MRDIKSFAVNCKCGLQSVRYFRLCGFEPFWDESGELAVCRRVVEGTFEFASPWWDDISDSAKDLILQVGEIL
jgi:serine/threonine-protein kinase RCK2